MHIQQTESRHSLCARCRSDARGTLERRARQLLFVKRSTRVAREAYEQQRTRWGRPRRPKSQRPSCWDVKGDGTNMVALPAPIGAWSERSGVTMVVISGAAITLTTCRN